LVTHVSQLITLSNCNWLFWYLSSCCFSHDEVVTWMVHVGRRQKRWYGMPQWKDNFMYIFVYCQMFFKVLFDGSEFTSADGVLRNIGKSSIQYNNETISPKVNWSIYYNVTKINNYLQKKFERCQLVFLFSEKVWKVLNWCFWLLDYVFHLALWKSRIMKHNKKTIDIWNMFEND